MQLVEYAQLLHDGSEIGLSPTDWTADKAKENAAGLDTLTLQLPTEKPPVTVPVIELFLK